MSMIVSDHGIYFFVVYSKQFKVVTDIHIWAKLTMPNTTQNYLDGFPFY